jgi:hypothetical protein
MKSARQRAAHNVKSEVNLGAASASTPMAKLSCLRTSLSQKLAQTVRELAIRYWVNTVRALGSNCTTVSLCAAATRLTVAAADDAIGSIHTTAADAFALIALRLFSSWGLLGSLLPADTKRITAGCTRAITSAERMPALASMRHLCIKRPTPNAMLSPTMAHFVCAGITANATPTSTAAMDIARFFMASRLNVTGPHGFSRATSCTSRRRRLMISSRAERNKSS